MKNRNKKKAGETSYANRLQEIAQRFDELCNNGYPCMSHGYQSQEKRAEVSNRIQRARNQGNNTPSSSLPQSVPESLSEKDLGSFRMGKTIKDSLPQYSLLALQIMSETSGTNRYPRFAPSGMRQKETLLWSMKSAMPKNETSANPAVSSTSFARVEKEIAKCISGCLSDVPSHKRNVHRILRYVVDYRVVQSHHFGTPKVSLHRVHLILQDNFQDSYFCKFCNIMLAGFMGVEPTNIEF